ncbi:MULTISPECIES: hypothetical protein [Haloarcula]|uniref:Uncharacterized protein n=1 Tax=Haloarcula pellucida TaxID=1427151 RepID=A0A830GN68_9EURY|nr:MULTISPECIES: hypothetical protein [Halomicroarcula]MBX0348982.1 hypothetical protein [Halomicroarcula pellucida]MDS0279438.1 hypothetical protein [Halomicroarcula sp. S1AR25-4]GGN98466.1 hypothetical protein GCM10009030_28860 [Halomicroarcula pellucida]
MSEACLQTDTAMSDDTTSPSDERTRRGFLRAGTATLAVGATASTTGCLSSLPPLGSSLSYGRLDVPPADEPAYRRWLPTPDAFETRYDDGYSFGSVEPGPYVADAPRKFRARRALFKLEPDYFGIGFENYDRMVTSNLGVVVEASFDRDAVASTLIGSGYAPDGTYRGYDLFARRDTERRVAVGDGVVVWTNAVEHPAANLELLIDTGAGDRTRYHEASDAFAAVSAAVGASRQVIAGPYSMDPRGDSEFGADAFRLGDDATYQVLAMHFAAGRTPTQESLESAFRESYRLTEESQGAEITVDGRLATVEARAPRRESVDPTPDVDPPQVTWGASTDAGVEALTLRHEAGDAVPAEWLWLDFEDGAGPNEVEKISLWPDRETVEPGDTTTVDLRDHGDPSAVNVVLSSGGTDFRMLFTYELE